MRVLVLGASGMLGSSVVPVLASAGFSVTAAARGQGMLPGCATALPCGDLRQPDTLRRVLDEELWRAPEFQERDAVT